VLRTAAILLGVLIIVAGITLMLVTGLEPKMVTVGLFCTAIGAQLIWYLTKSNAGTAPAETAVTAGRSYQKPLPPPAEKPKIDRL